MIRVAIELVAGARYQVVCRSETCTVMGGRQWKGGAWSWLAAARTEASAHKDLHEFTARQGGASDA